MRAATGSSRRRRHERAAEPRRDAGCPRGRSPGSRRRCCAPARPASASCYWWSSASPRCTTTISPPPTVSSSCSIGAALIAMLAWARRWSSSPATSTCPSVRSSACPRTSSAPVQRITPTSRSLGFVVGIAIGAVVGAINGFDHARAPGAQPGGHARDALHHPRRRRPLRQRPHHRPEHLPQRLRRRRFPHLLGIPWLAIIAARHRGRRRLRDASFRSGRDLYAIGSNPEAAALAGVPSARRVFTAFVISGAWPGWPGRCSWPCTPGRRDRGTWLRAAGHSGGRGGRRRDLRRQRHGRRRGARRPAAQHHQPGPGGQPDLRPSGTRLSPARCCWPPSPSTGGSPAGGPRPADGGGSAP